MLVVVIMVMLVLVSTKIDSKSSHDSRMTKERSCHDQGEALKDCIRATECYKSGKYTMKECLEREDNVQCKDLQYAYYVCKREQLDMRSRIQGIKSS